MKVTTITEAKKFIGRKLFWDDVSNRYIITRSGILTDIYRKHLEFDDQQDYKVLSDFKNLRDIE